MPLDPARYRRILVVKWSALGDVAIATVAIEDLRRAFPDARIDLHTLPAAQRLFEADSRFDEVFAIDLRERDRRCLRAWQWLRRVRSARYDLIVDLQDNDRSRMMLAWLRLCADRAEVWSRSGLPRHAAAILRHRALLAAHGVPAAASRPVLHASAQDRAAGQATRAAAQLREGGYAVFLPGSQRGGWLKRWGRARYAQLGRCLLAGGVERIAVIGGPDEADECAAIAAAIGAAAVHLDAPPLLQIPTLCAGAVFVIGNDTGLAHIAAAAGRPMIVLCGPTDPRRVKPVGDTVVALQARTACLNCYAKSCRWARDAACFAPLTPEAVADFALRGALSPTLQRF